jgi:hypothetical protein
MLGIDGPCPSALALAVQYLDDDDEMTLMLLNHPRVKTTGIADDLLMHADDEYGFTVLMTAAESAWHTATVSKDGRARRLRVQKSRSPWPRVWLETADRRGPTSNFALGLLKDLHRSRVTSVVDVVVFLDQEPHGDISIIHKHLEDLGVSVDGNDGSVGVCEVGDHVTPVEIVTLWDRCINDRALGDPFARNRMTAVVHPDMTIMQI